MIKPNLNLPNKTVPSVQPILNIAHRGARAYAPENTLPAFTKAKALGCQMFEMDLRMTKDGEIIVFHDDNLIRCTDAEKKFPNRENYRIAEFAHVELKQLDAGSWYVEQLALPKKDRQYFLQSLTDEEIVLFVTPGDRQLYRSGQVKIPTFQETLVLAKNLELSINVELKSPVEPAKEFVDGVIAAIAAMKMENSILISSFDHDLLREVRNRSKLILTAALSDNLMKAPITYLRKLKAAACNLGQYHDFNLDKFDSLAGRRYLYLLGKMRKAGFGVNIWTCNDPDEMAYLLKAGVTGLISDYPNRVRDKTGDF